MWGNTAPSWQEAALMWARRWLRNRPCRPRPSPLLDSIHKANNSCESQDVLPQKQETNGNTPARVECYPRRPLEFALNFVTTQPVLSPGPITTCKVFANTLNFSNLDETLLLIRRIPAGCGYLFGKKEPLSCLSDQTLEDFSRARPPRIGRASGY